MGENLPEDVPAPTSTDHEATEEGGQSKLTSANSDASAISVDNSKDFSLHCATATMLQGQSTEWTDERHSLYLDSLEASFVNDLYRSIYLGGSCLQNNFLGTYSSRAFPDKTNNSGQFMAPRDGCWTKINYERNGTILNTAVDCHGMTGSPWIHHFTSSGKRQYVEFPDLDEHTSDNERIHIRGKLTDFNGRARSSNHKPVCDKCEEDSVGNITEVSDQNFVDEDHGAKSSRKPTAKRPKAVADDTSSNDQVVPSRKFHTTDVSVVNNASSEREEQRQGRNELLSEQPEDFIFPKSDLHYFLRGS
ncbi:cold-regulated protein 27 isoform X2 [Ziziphus jujuba]|uniref:Cold-regulated protein 27 isoform X2 n=1 Tax=Ziziphus jujuba TaxID=326968 RepID=A0A6P4AEK1_ZIZJJ|nr:cold-regulated protein 27 isoform X2 [Ziziphus jujuba]